jgi:hypothetical protein
MVKRDSRTIVFDVSSHGFGHLGQISPVIVELIAQHPTARVVVRNTHAASVVKNILGFDVDLDEPPPEATLVMLDPTAVDKAASAEAYRALHARWDDDLERETARLEALSPRSACRGCALFVARSSKTSRHSGRSPRTTCARF